MPIVNAIPENSLPDNTFADNTLVAPGAHLIKIADGFDFTEGPATDAKGNIFFTDQPNDRILEWHAADGKITTFLQGCGRANGTCFDAQGDLWMCSDEHNALWRISSSGSVTVVVAEYEGKRLNGPNDVWIRPDGGLYITDPFYVRSYWVHGHQEQDTEGVYYLPPGGKTLRRVVSDFKQPNGIIGTPDGKTLYVADIGAGTTYRYTILPDGSLEDKRLFCQLGSDGMTIDSAGNVYLTGHGVTIFDPAGVQILHIPIPEDWTGNLCFGGTDRHTLFITASKSVYTVAMRVHGVGSQ
jgi:gluconolactonase